MGRKPFRQVLEQLSVSERIERAKSVTETLTYKVLEVIDLHEANKIIVYSGQLADQIPRSPAANAFTAFQSAMFNYEVIKSVALWDGAQDNAISIPTVIALIDDSKVLKALVEETRAMHASRETRLLNPSDDPEMNAAVMAASKNSQNAFADSQAEKALVELSDAVKVATETISSEQTQTVTNLRNHLSHSLSETRAEQNGPVPNMKYGDEKRLLSVSIDLIQDLYCWVNGTSFDIKDECVEQAKARAEELWLSCKFHIPSR